MRLLVVCSKNSGRIAPFITEQVDGLVEAGVICQYYTIEGKGILGYLKNLSRLRQAITKFQPDIIHAHYGLSGLLSNLQRRIPVITTYHGSDINNSSAYRFSKWAIRLSVWNIFVSQKNRDKSGVKKHYSLIPCGVNTDIFFPVDKSVARASMGWNEEEQLILFAGGFDNEVKNPALAIEAVKQLKGVRLIELKGYTREQVAVLMNAVDLCLMTSFSEGSPQFIKEAMACNCPIVSVAVGDVPDLLEGIDGCFVSKNTSSDLVIHLNKGLNFIGKTLGITRIYERNLDKESTTKKLMELYEKVSLHKL